jgi:putative hemolysin
MHPLVSSSLLQRLSGSLSSYSLRFATTPQDLLAAQRLRYEVFNLELQEGLSSAHASGVDSDPFDAVCDHLLVEHSESAQVVGTYRLQMGSTAAAKLGYYCGQEFELAPYEAQRSQIVELGRACIHAEHRSFSVLSLLWRGIGHYAQEYGGRYLLGCSSLSSQDPAQAYTAYTQLQRHLAPAHLRTQPHAAWVCPLDASGVANFKVPKLLAAYLSMGAWICGPPAIDREFKTIDFLTLIDLHAPGMEQRRKRFGMA